MLLGKLGKRIKFVPILVHRNDEIPAMFLKQLELDAVKTRACILPFSEFHLRSSPS